MDAVRTWLCLFAVLTSGCAKILGIEDYQLRDAHAQEGDAPPPFIDAAIDAPFGSALAYLKASNTGANDQFGTSLALSADGTTLVVGAPLEDNAGVGIDPVEIATAGDSGAAYVFVRDGTTWTQQAYLKASNTSGNDRFGTAVAISGDGSTIAIGAINEDSSATGIDGNQTSTGADNSGVVYVFGRTGMTWAQQAYVKASNTGSGDNFGFSVALSNDGTTLAVGAPLEDSSATTINGAQTNADPQTEGSNFGATYVFVRAGGAWVQQAYVKASNAGNGDQFGSALALSGDGDTLAVGAPREASNATGVNGNQSSEAAATAGAVYLFRRVAGIWAQQAYVKATNTGGSDEFGRVLALAQDGNTLAVGAYGEDSSATGIDGPNNNNASNSGAAYVYAQIAQTWTSQAYVKPSNTANGDQFGFAIALAPDGNTLVVCAPTEDGAGVGLMGEPADNLAQDAGAAFVFTRTAATWMQTGYLKATNTEVNDRYGTAVATVGALHVIGAIQEDSDATGIGGVQTSNLAASAGAVYVVQ